MTARRGGGALALALTMGIVGCSGDPGGGPGPDAGPGSDDGVGLTKIEGPIGAAATGALPRLFSPGAKAEDVAPDGFVHTRLAAMLLPGTLVGPLNGALETHKVRVAACAPGLLTLTLAMPRVADRAAAEELASRMRATGLFAEVAPTYVVADDDLEVVVGKTDGPAPATPGLGSKKAAIRPPSSPLGEGMAHLEAMRLPAAWNLKALVRRRVLGTVDLLVPGQFKAAGAHPDVSTQRFVDTGGFVLSGALDGSGVYLSSVVAADFNGDGLTGTSAVAGETLATWGVPLAPSWDLSQAQTAVLDAVSRIHPGGRTVLLWRQGWSGKTFAQLSKRFRVALALEARLLARRHARTLLVVSASGRRRTQHAPTPPPEETAVWNSAFNLDANGGDFAELFSAEERRQLEVQRLLAVAPEVSGQRSLNLVVVGATVAGGGAEAPFSAQPSEVRAVGEAIPGYCEPDATGCSSGRMLVNSATAAAAQVAGLSAWLWNLYWLEEGRSIAGLLALAFDPGRLGAVNAYQASLVGLGGRGELLRLTLLDVAGGGASGDGPDGRFDEKDLASWLDKLTSYTDSRMFGRHDLNGDGYTMPDGHSEPFDLNMSGLPLPPAGEVSYVVDGGAPVRLDEAQVEDLEVLCYYAYSPIYVGDADRRGERLGARCKLPTVRISPAFSNAKPGQVHRLTAIVEYGRIEDLRWSTDGGALQAPDGSPVAMWTAPDAEATFQVKVWLTSRPRRSALASIQVSRCPPPPTCAAPDAPVVACKLKDDCTQKAIDCDCKPEKGKTDPRTCNLKTGFCCSHACPTANVNGCDGPWLSLCEEDEKGCRRWKHLEDCYRRYNHPTVPGLVANNRFCYSGKAPPNSYPADYLVSAPRCACKAEYHLQDPCFSNKTGWVCWKDIHSTSPNPYAWKLCAMDPVGACAIVTHDGPGGLASCTPPYP